MQMIQFPLRALVVMLVGGGFAVLANMLALIMAGKINERVRAGERVSYLGWDASIRGKFKQLYPGHKLVLLFDLSIALMLVCFPILLWTWVFAH